MAIGMVPAVVTLTGVLFFAFYYCWVLRPQRDNLDWISLHDQPPLTLGVERHKTTGKDRIIALVITVLYAATAFFSLGDTVAPQTYVDMSGGKQLTVEIADSPICPSSIRLYSLLGTGGFNLEISPDGEHWSTLWTRIEKDQWDRDMTVYYWADAEGLEPSYALPQPYDEMFKWRDIAPENPQEFRYFRLTGREDNSQQTLQLSKLLFLNEDGSYLTYDWALTDGSVADQGVQALLTVDETCPTDISWRNSAYFDEIYHPRTALEHIEELKPFEWTHPPLGKLILGIGIRLFGMTPFGWRFMGTLLGVLMVPILYVFLKNFFGKTPVATCGTILLATEFMHLTQTRLATIDTYGVFFVLTSYFFFYRWLTSSATPTKDGKRREGYGSLALSGLCFGLGIASKWTVVYGGLGLLFLGVLQLVLRFRGWEPQEPGRGKWLFKTLLVALSCFILVPAVIYTLSYLPYARAYGVEVTLAGTWNGFVTSLPIFFRKLFLGSKEVIPKDSLSSIMVENQWAMFDYHKGVHSSHPFAASWYQWLVDGRPVLYYHKDLAGGMTQRFCSFNNPILSWAGLLAVIAAFTKCFRRMWAKRTAVTVLGVGCAALCWKVGQVKNGAFDPKLAGQTLRLGPFDLPQLPARLALLIVCLLIFLAVGYALADATQERRDGKSVFISVGYLAQLLPWVLVSRITYAYHYFPSTIFLIFAICLQFSDFMDSQRVKNWKIPVYGLTAGSAALYIAFYPGLTGLTMPTWYAALLRFLPSWPL